MIPDDQKEIPVRVRDDRPNGSNGGSRFRDDRANAGSDDPLDASASVRQSHQQSAGDRYARPPVASGNRSEIDSVPVSRPVERVMRETISLSRQSSPTTSGTRTLPPAPAPAPSINKKKIADDYDDDFEDYDEDFEEYNEDGNDTKSNRKSDKNPPKSTQSKSTAQSTAISSDILKIKESMQLENSAAMAMVKESSPSSTSAKGKTSSSSSQDTKSVKATT